MVNVCACCNGVIEYKDLSRGVTMLRIFYRYVGVAVCATYLLLLASCGGQDNTSNTDAKSAVQKGGVSLILTDAPSDEFSEVNFTFTKIEFLGAESGPVTLFEGEQSVNLLSLTNFGQLLAVIHDVPVGTYSKIRLTLKKPDGIALIPLDGSDPIYPPLSGNGKMDLLPRHPFSVSAGEMLYLQLDIDAKKSLHIVDTGKGKPGYKVRPIVFIDILSEQLTGKLVRVSGYAHSAVAEGGEFVLCTYPRESPEMVSVVTDRLCVDVATTSSSVFDNKGDPIAATDILQDSELTVVGFINAALVKIADKPRIGMTAEVIEMGSAEAYFKVNGIINTAPLSETDTFTFDTSVATNIPARLQPGAKIFQRDGTRLDYTAIQTGVEAGLDGVPATTDPTEMKTTLVVIDNQPPALSSSVSGLIQSMMLADNTLMVNDVMIVVSAETVAIKAGEMSDAMVSETMSVSELMPEDDVVIYGQYNSEGQLIASLILKKI